MNLQPNTDVTQFLLRWRNGDEEAFKELMPLVYDDLRRIAARHLRRERANHSLQPTALVNEAYLRLVDQTRANWQNRAHFFGVAAQMMRRILVDHARRVARRPRFVVVTTENALEIAGKNGADVDLLALDEALDELERLDPVQAKVVLLRYFMEMTNEETAEALQISTATVKREWVTARAWLFNRLKSTQ